MENSVCLVSVDGILKHANIINKPLSSKINYESDSVIKLSSTNLKIAKTMSLLAQLSPQK